MYNNRICIESVGFAYFIRIVDQYNIGIFPLYFYILLKNLEYSSNSTLSLIKIIIINEVLNAVLILILFEYINKYFN